MHYSPAKPLNWLISEMLTLPSLCTGEHGSVYFDFEATIRSLIGNALRRHKGEACILLVNNQNQNQVILASRASLAEGAS